MIRAGSERETLKFYIMKHKAKETHQHKWHFIKL